MWSGAEVVRNRRETLGLSLADVAEKLGVSRSYVSLLENGKRQASEDQIAALAGLLGLPGELLTLGWGRLPAEIDRAVRADAASVAAAVRQTSEQRAVAYQTEPALVPGPAAPAQCRGDLPPPPDTISVKKATTTYRAHSYHTKVPPEAITPFVRAFTRPGDIVLDPFCGSGMTGVAALMEGRGALLSDISVAAVHIARNYTTPCDPSDFAEALERVRKRVDPTMAWLYRPAEMPWRTVEYTTWSDVYSCPRCAADIVYWDAARLASKGMEVDAVTCPSCLGAFRKAELRWITEVPVESHASCGRARIDSHGPTAAERALIAEADAAPIPYWLPTAPFGPDREMWRASHGAMGIVDVAGFFTRRNLHALAALRHAILMESEGRIREALMFAFTAAVNRASRRYQWNAKRPTNVMTGTLYISSLRYEWNVWSLFARKARDVARYYASFPTRGGRVEVFQRSAADLSCLPDGCASMVFMDPPFGSNIFYADSSLLWEAWLGSLTDDAGEIVVSRNRGRVRAGKTLADYTEMMGRAFAEAARVLRPGGTSVLAFSNTDDQVWTGIQTALSSAGLTVEGVHVLDKGQPSIKGVKGVQGKERVTGLDLVLRLGHRGATVRSAALPAAQEEFIDGAIRGAMTAGISRIDAVYSAVLRDAIAAGHSAVGITIPLIESRLALLKTSVPAQQRDEALL